MTEFKCRELLLILASIGISNAFLNDGPCKSDDCWKQRAREIEESLDVTIDPCDNFYEFSCGGWMKKNPAPRYYKSWTPSDVYNHKMMTGFAKILNSPDESTDSLSLKSMKHIFKNCMDTKQRDETGFDIIESLEIIQGWPILGDKYQTQFEVIPSSILPVITRVFGVDTFFTIDNYKHEDYRATYVYWSRTYGYNLDDILIKFERNSTEVKKYINSIVNVVKEISANRKIPFNTIKTLKDANDIIDFQLELIKVVKESTPGRSEVFQSSDDFKNWFDAHVIGVNNSHALRFCYLNSFPAFSSKEDEDTEFIVENIKLLGNLIVLFDKTKPDTLQNFIIWDLVYKYLKFMPTRMYDIEFELNNIGKDTPEVFLNREKRCIMSLPFLTALVPKFVSVYYPENYKNSSAELITKVIESSEKYVNKTSWMSSDLKNSLLQRIPNSIQYNYHSFTDNNYIDKLNGYPKIFSKNYLEDSLLISRLNHRRRQQLFDNPDFDAKSFNLRDGSIILWFLSYLLSKFQPDVPQATNYGTFASVVGQSVTSFISSIDFIFGKSSDDDDDWPQDMKNEYLRRFHDFEMQLNNYSKTYGLSDDTKKINISRQFMASFLEDNFGVPVAFAAYEKNKTPEDEEISLPNYPMYRDRKLFFISYAGSLCNSGNPESLVNGKKINLKISQMVNFALGNMKEFSDAFSCPQDSPMNPAKKIYVFGPDDQMNSN